MTPTDKTLHHTRARLTVHDAETHYAAVAQDHDHTPRAFVALSGGLDSTTLAALLLHAGWEVTALSYDYGQRHRTQELAAARQIARHLGLSHHIVDLKTLGTLLGSGSLVSNTPVPEGHYAEATMAHTVVPNRNMVLLSLLAAVALGHKASLIAYGAHASDYAIYPDCRPVFVRAFQTALSVGNTEHLEVHAPFLSLHKPDIVALAVSLNVPVEKTWSCYKGQDYHCGRCGTCVERREAFHLAEEVDHVLFEDPTYWQTVVKPR